MAEYGLDALVAEKRRVRTAITRLYNKKEAWESETSEGRLDALMSKVEETKNDLNTNLHSTYEAWYAQCKAEGSSKKELDATIDQESDLHDNYLDKIFECQAVLKNRLKVLNMSMTQDMTGLSLGNQNAQFSTRLKAPQIPLPFFNSKPDEDISQFLRSFEDTVEKFGCGPYDKFILLPKQIKGKAANLLRGIEPKKQSCEQAKGILETALASRQTQVSNLLNKFTKLEMSEEDPYFYWGDIIELIGTLETL